MVEKLDYEVLGSVDGVEIRKYQELLLATVFGKSDTESFNILFNFISGQNEAGKKISMTAPVVSSVGKKEERFFTFVMPSKYDRKSLPKPVSPLVIIHVQENKIFAVLDFGGRATNKRTMKRREEFLGVISKRELKTRGGIFLMRYNSPFMPGPFRTNEIGIELIFYPGK